LIKSRRDSLRFAIRADWLYIWFISRLCPYYHCYSSWIIIDLISVDRKNLEKNKKVFSIRNFGALAMKRKPAVFCTPVELFGSPKITFVISHNNLRYAGRTIDWAVVTNRHSLENWLDSVLDLRLVSSRTGFRTKGCNMSFCLCRFGENLSSKCLKVKDNGFCIFSKYFFTFWLFRGAFPNAVIINWSAKVGRNTIVGPIK
jgi:hypothetical protein